MQNEVLMTLESRCGIEEYNGYNVQGYNASKGPESMNTSTRTIIKSPINNC